MNEKKKELQTTIESVTNEKVIDYLLAFSKDFIARYDKPGKENN